MTGLYFSTLNVSEREGGEREREGVGREWRGGELLRKMVTY